MKVSYDFLPKLEPVEGSSKLAAFHEDWYATVDGRRFWIPAGYFMNGASIPRVFWALIGSPFQPDYWAAAGFHDYLYLTHLENRAFADEAIYQLLRKAGVNTVKAHIIWAAVRSCGMFAWHNGTKDLEDLMNVKRMVAERPEHDGWKFGMGVAPVGAV